MLLTKKYKIKPTNEQLDVLWNLPKQYTLIYKLSLSERKEVWKRERKNIKYSHQQDNLAILKEQYPSLYSLYSKTFQGVLQKLDANYKSFF
ncbi:helix-turn-helix domain-containing protein [Methanohalobium sp.]|uniref:helix-turn-helix domain-containing protein n=1 Tax=Methanohalobium sp. TaxID=2837493 RepID=UPI0025EFE64D|nr:helix-turn-helix domain-containing protein [Methanohalobium sp.]